MDIGIAHHTSKKRGTYTIEWGTPEYILAPFRPIALDLASSAEHNKRVCAVECYTKKHPFFNDMPTRLYGGSVWCNPPGPMKEVVRFFQLWESIITEGNNLGGFLVFNADHFRAVQKIQPRTWLRVTFLDKRVKYVGAKHSATFPSILISTAGIDVDHLGLTLDWR